jgi:hypothetical protein
MIDLDLIGRLDRTIGTIHGCVYFAPQVRDALSAIGLHRRSQYFASRAAPLGPAGPELVEATFYNFSPTLIGDAMTGVWDKVEPRAVQRARFAGVEALFDAIELESVLTSAVVERATAECGEVVRESSWVARPLAAANAAVELPSEPAILLWQLLTILREWRGDAHISLLSAEPLDPVECLIAHAATGQVPAGILQSMRSWTDDEWTNGTARLVGRDWVDSAGGFTEYGKSRREAIERRTDEMSATRWDVLGEERCGDLLALLRPVAKAIVESGVLPVR